MIVDLILIGVVVLSGILAFARGFVHEVLAVAAWVGAIFIAMYGFTPLAPLVRQWIPAEWVANIVTGAVLFIAALIVLSLISRVLSRGVRGSILGALDRSLGFLYGLLRGAVLIALAYIGFTWLVPPAEQPGWLKSARAFPLIVQSGRMLCALAPVEIAEAKTGACARIVGRQGGTGGDPEEALRRLISPPTKPTAPSAKPGYKDAERREMDRLIQSTE